MRLRVGASRRLIYQAVAYHEGDEFDVPDESAEQWLRTGLVLPADGVWPEGIYSTPGTAPAAKPEPAASAHGCETPTKPPGKALAVCTTSGCACLVLTGACRECRNAQTRQRRAKDKGHQRAYRRKDWLTTRRDHLRANPYCACDDCLTLPEILRPVAEVVDHIDGLGALGPRAHDPSNLRSMTKAHHDRHTMRTQVHGIGDGM